MLAGLPGDQVLHAEELGCFQVIEIDQLILYYDSNLRKCDYKNLHLSPLCNLDSKLDSYLWGDNVADLYSALDPMPEYVSDIENTRRPSYASDSIILHNTKVSRTISDTCNRVYVRIVPCSTTLLWRRIWPWSLFTLVALPLWVGGVGFVSGVN